MNRLHSLFSTDRQRLLSIYLTAGYPTLEATAPLIQALDTAGVDLLEVGMPFSDPLADGPTIQHTSEQALDAGMTLSTYFEQVTSARAVTQIPMVFMGYVNQVYRLGLESFCERCVAAGIDGLIVPDLSLEVYESEWRETLERYALPICFLITPQTSEERIRKAAALSSGFLYAVADASITGSQTDLRQAQLDYFARIQAMDLSCPTLIGFGISNRSTFETACEYARGAIVGSAFLRHLAEHPSPQSVQDFVLTLRPNSL